MTDEFGILGGSNPHATALKHELSQVILWNEHNAPRSLQRAIGPSELGDPCDRKLAYRIAGIEPVNFGDPWPAIVGTSIHDGGCGYVPQGDANGSVPTRSVNASLRT